MIRFHRVSHKNETTDSSTNWNLAGSFVLIVGRGLGPAGNVSPQVQYSLADRQAYFCVSSYGQTDLHQSVKIPAGASPRPTRSIQQFIKFKFV